MLSRSGTFSLHTPRQRLPQDSSRHAMSSRKVFSAGRDEVVQETGSQRLVRTAAEAVRLSQQYADSVVSMCLVSV